LDRGDGQGHVQTDDGLQPVDDDAHLDAAHLALLWVMWAVMMIGMMLPSAAPAIVIYGSAARRRHGADAPTLTYALAAGYLAVWIVFGVLAIVVQRALGVLLHWACWDATAHGSAARCCWVPARG
jgi:predicted metal-binding membrane protein